MKDLETGSQVFPMVSSVEGMAPKVPKKKIANFVPSAKEQDDMGLFRRRLKAHQNKAK